jgi:hypothetical protein
MTTPAQTMPRESFEEPASISLVNDRVKRLQEDLSGLERKFDKAFDELKEASHADTEFRNQVTGGIKAGNLTIRIVAWAGGVLQVIGLALAGWALTSVMDSKLSIAVIQSKTATWDSYGKDISDVKAASNVQNDSLRTDVQALQRREPDYEQNLIDTAHLKTEIQQLQQIQESHHK